MQQQLKEVNDMRLKTEIVTSTNTGLVSENEHLLLELKETKQLSH
jgi:hypothetical protein